MKHPDAQLGMLGFVPQFFSEEDPRPAREQINENYKHGGGWLPIHGFTMSDDGLRLNVEEGRHYPLIAETQLRGETIRFYNGSWVAIIQPDGAYEISRVD